MASQATHSDLDLVVHMQPAMRRDAEAYSQKEGVSLGDFVNAAVADKLAHLRHEEWLHNRTPSTPESRASLLALLDRMGTDEVEAGDELPEGYVRS